MKAIQNAQVISSKVVTLEELFAKMEVNLPKPTNQNDFIKKAELSKAKQKVVNENKSQPFNQIEIQKF